MKTDHALSEELPYWEFFAEPVSHAVLTNGHLVRGATVSLRDIECLDDSEVNSFTELLRGALNSLNEGVRVQFCLSVDSNFSESISGHQNLKANQLPKIVDEISKQRLGELENAQASGELYRPKLVVFLQMPMLTPKRQGFFKRAEEFESVTETVYTESLEALNENFESLISGLRACGLECAALSDVDFKTHVYNFLNPARKVHSPTPLVVTPTDQELPAKIVEESPWLAPQSPREQLAFGDLSLQQSQFVLDGYGHRVISLKTLPETTTAGQLSAFLRLPFHYAMTLSFEVPPQSAEMSKLQQRRKMAHSLATTHGANASDLESESKLSATEELIRELLNSGQRIFATQTTVLLKAPATEDGARTLNRQTREVLSRFRMLQGAEGLEETVGAWKVQKTTLPGAVLSLERGRKMKTNNLADFLPVYPTGKLKTEAYLKKEAPINNKGLRVEEARKHPDLVLNLGAETTAFEIELNQKSRARYRAILRGYKRGGFERIVYLIRSKGTMNAIESAAYEVSFPRDKIQLGFGSIGDWKRNPIQTQIHLDHGSQLISNLIVPRIIPVPFSSKNVIRND